MKLMNKEKKEIKDADIEEIEEKSVEKEEKSQEKVEVSTKTVENKVKEEKESTNNVEKDYLLEEYYRKKEQERNRGNSSFKLFFVIVIAFVIGGIAMLSLLKFTPLLDEVLGGSSNTVITKNKTQVYEKGSLAASVEKIYDAVVLIQTYKNDELVGSGTGFVYKTDDKYGYLLTNNHVVENTEKVTVTFSNDEEAEVTVLGKDAYLDLAVLRVDKKYVSLIANIGSSEDCNLGDTVFTVGAPMGYEYRGSVTSGILSGKDRLVSVAVSSTSNDWVMRVLQIDASINPGNSGGPLLNVNGEVIGVCSMKLVDDKIEGMGFAIPIEYAMSHVEQLEKGEAIEWPFLGVGMANITDTMTLYKYNVRVPDSVKAGVVVVSVEKDSAAEKAGIQLGDVITKIAGKKTDDVAYLRYELYQHSAGDEVEVTVLRDGKEKTFKVTLGKKSSD